MEREGWLGGTCVKRLEGVVKSHAPNEIKPCSQQTTLKGLVGSDSSVQIPTSDRILGLTFKICSC